MMLQEARSRLKRRHGCRCGDRRDARPNRNRSLARGSRGPAAPTAGIQAVGGSKRWTSTRCSRADPASPWLMNLPTPTLPAAATPSAICDVEELLGRGIDVYTTLNVQHIESLNDVIAQITGVRVRETFPIRSSTAPTRSSSSTSPPTTSSSASRKARSTSPSRPKKALEHFFAPPNDGAARARLAAHRRAGRRAVARRDAGACDLGAVAGRRAPAGLRQRGSRARQGWCASPSACRTVLHAAWTTLYVESGRSLQLTEEERDRIAERAPHPGLGGRVSLSHRERQSAMTSWPIQANNVAQ